MLMTVLNLASALIDIAVSGCVAASQPLPDIDATVEARVTAERAAEATVEATAQAIAKAMVEATAEAAPTAKPVPPTATPSLVPITPTRTPVPPTSPGARALLGELFRCAFAAPRMIYPSISSQLFT